MERENKEKVNLRALRMMEKIGGNSCKRTWINVLEKYSKVAEH